MEKYRLYSLTDTKNMATAIASLLESGDVLCLEGTLGAGKTTFSQALINAYMKKEMHVTSPTFTLVQLYESEGKTPIWHCDFYRLKHEDEIQELGIEDAFDTAITLIEWPNIAQAYLPRDRLQINFDLISSEAESDEYIREITLTATPITMERFGKELAPWKHKETR